MRWFFAFRDDDTATTAVEYAVMLALILTVIISAVAAMGESNGGMWANNKQKLENTSFGN